jgi:hypothetical protein
MRKIISNVLRKLANCVDLEVAVAVPRWTLAALRPLTPRYSKKRHGLYLSGIEEALKKPTIRNIALSGSYGVGKSSVLLEVARVHGKRAISISLSTLGLDAAAAEGSTGGAAATKTNQIQKEIVKQLLYSQDPAKMPGSRFERNTRFRWVTRALLSLLVAIPVLVVFVLTRWTNGLAKAAGFDTSTYGWMSVIVYSFAALGSFVILRLVHNRLQLSQVTAGSATISLAPKSGTYFDQYLDEIVYLFEIDSVDVVIFEDIDRFDDPHIFETLRSLNTLLNGAKQLNGRNVRFIYAIKDSIFDELGLRSAKEEAVTVGRATDAVEGSAEKLRADAAMAELARANRTKFFDLVIPMVPFITHLSARDLLLKQMKGTKVTLPDELVDLAGRYVADMRLIKDIRNEFIVFNDRVVTGGTLKLTKDGVFAMILYKTVHLSDFERIRLGESDLDLLYSDFRRLVGTAISDRRVRIAAATKQLQTLAPIATQGEMFGNALVADIAAVARQLSLLRPQVSFNGRGVSEDELRTDAFWTEFAASGLDLTVTATAPNTLTFDRTLTHEDIGAIVGYVLKSASWVASRQRTLNAEIAKETEASDFLSHATMAALAGRDDWKAKVDDVEIGFEGLLQKHLKSELARRLVSQGFIDRNFTLYTSRYYTNRVSAEATNYIIKNVDLNQVDIYAVLSAQDVISILQERGRGILREPAAYNINILDYLLNEDPAGTSTLIDRLVRYGGQEQDLVLAYFQSGAEKEKLAAALTPKWPHILPFLINELPIEPEERLDLVDAALMEIAHGVEYETDDQVTEYLSTHYQDLLAFIKNGDIRNSTDIAAFLASNGPMIPDLAPLSEELQDAVVKVGAYDITRANLVIATGESEPSLALDALDDLRPNVFARVILDLREYLVALTADEFSIIDPGKFAETLEKVLEADPTSVAEVIHRSSVECIIATGIANLSTELWQPLAHDGRLKVGSNNLFDYTIEFGIDENVAPSLQTAARIDLDPDETEPHKQRIAADIVSSSALPSTQLRAELASSLQLESYLPIAAVPVVLGHLVGDLIEHGVIEDNAAAFVALEPSDVEGRAYAISKSVEFANFMSPAELPLSQLPDLLTKPEVPLAVKAIVIARFDEFTATAGRDRLTAAARYAVSSSLSVGFTSLMRLASAGVETGLVIDLLSPHLSSASISDLDPVLTATGGKYSELTTANGKHPKFDDTAGNRQLLARMKELGTVHTWGPEDRRLKANMVRPR